MGIYFTMVFIARQVFQRKNIKMLRKRNYWKNMKQKKYSRCLWIICKYFLSDKYYSYSQVLWFTNYSYSYSYKSWLRKSIPIPICQKNNYSLITGLIIHLFRTNPVIFRTNPVIFRTNPVILRTNSVIFRTNQVFFRINPVIFMINAVIFTTIHSYLRQSSHI